MDLSLLGASVLLLLCNPVLLVHSYDFWLCFGAAWIYLLGAGLIYEVILYAPLASQVVSQWLVVGR